MNTVQVEARLDPFLDDMLQCLDNIAVHSIEDVTSACAIEY